MIVIVFGLPGSGKSYFAERLAKLMGAVYINSDRTRIALGLNGDYSPRSKMLVYKKMTEMGEAALEKGNHVVMDATFHLRKFREMMCDSYRKDQVCFVEIFTSESLTKERTNTKREFSDANFEVYQKMKQEFQPMNSPHLKLTSTNHNLDELLDKAIDYIKLNKAS